MDIVYLSRLTMQSEEGPERGGIVTIGREENVWRAEWQEAGGDCTVWYEGESSGEMIACFRSGMEALRQSGFEPIVAEENRRRGASGRSAGRSNAVPTSLLQYFAAKYHSEDVLEKLKAWRREQAREEKVAPYWIATNELLTMLAAYFPQNRDQLSQIPGMGEHRCESYGDKIVSIIGEFEPQGSFPLDWVAGSVDVNDFQAWYKERQNRRAELAEKKENRKQSLLRLVAKGSSLQEMGEKLDLSRRELVEWLEKADREGADVLPSVRKELEGVPQERLERASALFDSEGDRYLKPVAEALKAELKEGEEPDPEELYAWLRLLRIQRRKQREQAAKAG